MEELEYNDDYPEYPLSLQPDSYYYYSNMTYPGEIMEKTRFEVISKITFYVISITLALLGNGMVVAVVLGNKRMRSTTNFYIVNLAVSDMLVTLCCSWVHLVTGVTHGWWLGDFFCRFNSFAQVVSIVSSIMTLTLIACDRFFGIVYAMEAHVVKIKARYAIIAVWLVSIIVATPLLFVRRLEQRQWLNHLEQYCIDHWPHTQAWTTSRKVYYTFVSVVLYVIPVVVMNCAYCVIIIKLWARRAPGETMLEDSAQERLKKRVILMLVVVLVLFTICWLPYHVVIIYDLYRRHAQLPPWYNPLQYAAIYLGYTNSSINPLIYAAFNENFRQGFKVLLRCVVKGRQSTTTATTSSRRESDYQSTTVVTKF